MLNIVFLVVAAVLVVHFLHTGGPAMLRMMNTPEEEMAHHDHAMAELDHRAMGHYRSAARDESSRPPGAAEDV